MPVSWDSRDDLNGKGSIMKHITFQILPILGVVVAFLAAGWISLAGNNVEDFYNRLLAMDVSNVPILGPMIGEVDETSAIIWYRNAYNPRNLQLTWTSLDGNSFGSAKINILPDADFTSKTKIHGLLPNTNYVLRIVHDKAADNNTHRDDDIHNNNKIIGKFKTPGAKAVSFVFGSCIAGQGFGRIAAGQPDQSIHDSDSPSTPMNGYPIFQAIESLQPDFLQMNGDTIYADNEIEAVSTMMFNEGSKYLVPLGKTVWPRAKTVEEYRARYRYTLEDPALASLLSQTVVYNTWDDHEIEDDFGKAKLEAEGKQGLYQAGQQAFHEYWPLVGVPEEPNRIYRKFSWGPHADLFILDTRTYRSIHSGNATTTSAQSHTPQMETLLGSQQLAWFKHALSNSKATWKFVANSVPISYPTGWPDPVESGYDGWSDGNSATISGPEKELLDIFQHIHQERIQGVTFLGGDVHFPFAIAYDPFNDGKPLVYEFGASPFQALCLPPFEQGPDKSFRPTVLFETGSFNSNLWNFGYIKIDHEGSLNFSIRNVVGTSIFDMTLAPPRATVDDSSSAV